MRAGRAGGYSDRPRTPPPPATTPRRASVPGPARIVRTFPCRRVLPRGCCCCCGCATAASGVSAWRVALGVLRARPAPASSGADRGDSARYTARGLRSPGLELLDRTLLRQAVAAALPRQRRSISSEQSAAFWCLPGAEQAVLLRFAATHLSRTHSESHGERSEREERHAFWTG